MNSLPAARARLALLAASLAVPLALGGCDSLPFLGDDDEKKAEEADADEASKKEEEDKAKEEDKASKEKAEAEREKEIEARIATEAEKAAKEAREKALAEVEAKKREDEEASKPVKITEVSVKTSGGVFGGGGGMLQLEAKADIREKLGSSTYVHVKSVCKDGARFVSDVSYLSAHYSKPLEQYESGETAEVTGNIYTQGLLSPLSPCQMHFRLGGIGGGGISVDLGDACWDGSDTSLGTCDPPVAAVAASGATTAMEVQDVTVNTSSSYGSSTGLNVNYLLGLNKPADTNARLTMTAACEKDGKRFIDVAQANFMAGPFNYEPGESIARSANLFWNSAFGFTASPTPCDLTTALWTMKSGSYGEYEENVLDSSCWKDGKVAKGNCTPGKSRATSFTKMSVDNTALDDVSMKLVPPYGATDKFQLQIQADATVSERIQQSQGVNAKVTCKAGKEKRVETAYLFAVEFYYLQPGETTRMSSTSFSSHALENVKWCQVEFTGGERYSMTPGSGVDLGTYCLKKEKITKRKC